MFKTCGRTSGTRLVSEILGGQARVAPTGRPRLRASANGSNFQFNPQLGTERRSGGRWHSKVLNLSERADSTKRAIFTVHASLAPSNFQL